MRLVIVESPFAGDVQRNLEYARACMKDCLHRGEAPFASHTIYTQPGVLNDDDPGERTYGIKAGLAWGAKADATVVYVDFGISRGMELGIKNAQIMGRPIEYRSLFTGEAPLPVEVPPNKPLTMSHAVDTVHV
jgi:hypothetical protein